MPRPEKPDLECNSEPSQPEVPPKQGRLLIAINSNDRAREPIGMDDASAKTPEQIEPRDDRDEKAEVSRLHYLPLYNAISAGRR